ncbi:MAG: methyltransferase domain-containing protein [Paracoccaceae bacterium]
MGQKIDTRAIGLDTGLALIKWLTGAENLHYGLWDGLELSAGNLRRAQDAYSDKLFALLPPEPLRILDIGGGAGETARKLLALGHSVEIIVPSAYLAARCRENAPGARVHECIFQEFAGQGPFDLCLFSESFQYIPLADSLPRCLPLLTPTGSILIADCFRTDAYQGRAVHGPQPGGGHRLTAFRAAVASLPLDVTHDEDITDSVAPSIDLEQGFFHVLGTGLASAQSEIGAKKPRTWWFVCKALGLFLSEKRRRNLGQRLTDTSRTADVFRHYNRYIILRLSKG